MWNRQASRRNTLPGYRRSWREWLAIYRRPLAACLAGLAVACSLSALAPDHAPTIPVVVAARDLPTGAVLGVADLEVRHVASEAVPPDVQGEVGDLAGRQLAVPVAAGAPVPSASLVGPGLLTGTDPGTVAVPLRPSDPETLALLSPGQLVDVVISEGNGYEQPVESSVIARSVAVLWVPRSEDAGSWLGSGSSPGMVVVAASQQQSTALAGAGSRGRIFLVLVGGEP
jgi:pilus assembly protein CpaB